MQVQQCFQSSDTNSPCGLTILLIFRENSKNQFEDYSSASVLQRMMRLSKERTKQAIISGGFGEVAIPVPIPNTEVKHLIADGTMRFAAWESRTLPD